MQTMSLLAIITFPAWFLSMRLPRALGTQKIGSVKVADNSSIPTVQNPNWGALSAQRSSFISIPFQFLVQYLNSVQEAEIVSIMVIKSIVIDEATSTIDNGMTIVNFDTLSPPKTNEMEIYGVSSAQPLHLSVILLLRLCPSQNSQQTISIMKSSSADEIDKMNPCHQPCVQALCSFLDALSDSTAATIDMYMNLASSSIYIIIIIIIKLTTYISAFTVFSESANKSGHSHLPLHLNVMRTVTKNDVCTTVDQCMPKGHNLLTWCPLPIGPPVNEHDHKVDVLLTGGRKMSLQLITIIIAWIDEIDSWVLNKCKIKKLHQKHAMAHEMSAHMPSRAGEGVFVYFNKYVRKHGEVKWSHQSLCSSYWIKKEFGLFAYLRKDWAADSLWEANKFRRWLGSLCSFQKGKLTCSSQFWPLQAPEEALLASLSTIYHPCELPASHKLYAMCAQHKRAKVTEPSLHLEGLLEAAVDIHNLRFHVRHGQWKRLFLVT